MGQQSLSPSLSSTHSLCPLRLPVETVLGPNCLNWNTVQTSLSPLSRNFAFVIENSQRLNNRRNTSLTVKCKAMREAKGGNILAERREERWGTQGHLDMKSALYCWLSISSFVGEVSQGLCWMITLVTRILGHFQWKTCVWAMCVGKVLT